MRPHTLWGLPSPSMHHFLTGVLGTATFSRNGWRTTVKSSLVSYRPLSISCSVPSCQRRQEIGVGTAGETQQNLSHVLPSTFNQHLNSFIREVMGKMGSREVCSLTSFCSFKEAALWPLAPLNALPLAQSLLPPFTQSRARYLASITLPGTDLPEPRAGAEPTSGLPDIACSFQPGQQILSSYRQTSGHKDTETCQQNQKGALVIILNERFRSSGLGFDVFFFFSRKHRESQSGSNQAAGDIHGLVLGNRRFSLRSGGEVLWN